MTSVPKITPFLWFDTQAEEAANLYVSIFPDSEIEAISRYGKEGFELHGRPAGSVMTVSFRLAGQTITALNGGPVYKLSEAFSFQVHCDTQEEIDHYWSKLSAGGSEGRCGWLEDRFGLSWQIVPSALPRLMSDPDPRKVQRVTRAFLQMSKFDLAALERAREST
jgi:predicted 3-demethylubiquinone-9 3-methyltransferase (glyoxalase superfamily)